MGCQAYISRYRIAQTTCAMQRNLTSPALLFCNWPNIVLPLAS